MIPKIITYKILKEKFQDIFSVPLTTEVWVEEIQDGWILDFERHGYCVVCKVMIKDLIDELRIELEASGKDLTKESVDNAITKFKNEFLRFSIPSDNSYDFFPEKTFDVEVN